MSTASTLDYLITVHVSLKMGYSIHILSIKIDTKSFEYGSTISNCPSLQALRIGVFHYARLLGPLEWLYVVPWY